MKILKIKGKNEQIINEQIKKEYGDSAIILSTQQEREKGLLNWLRGPKTVVTVAVKEEDDSLKEVKEELGVKDSEASIASYDVLLALKEQVDEMQESIKALNTSNEEESTQNIKETSNSLMTLLEAKLLEQGIHPEVIQEVLESKNEEADIEEIVRDFYTTTEKLLSESVDEEELPKVIFFVGPTGVGKTTTIAKLTANYVLNKSKKVVLFTSDTYRIAAIDQLKTYADILGVEIEIIYDEGELQGYLDKWQGVDHIFIDTAGRSHKNIEQLQDIKALLDSVEQKEVVLVINASTAYNDVKRIIDTYEGLCENFKLIITKLDETDQIGNIINIVYYAKRPVLYLTNGQNVPADIEAFNVQGYTSDLLGRISYE